MINFETNSLFLETLGIAIYRYQYVGIYGELLRYSWKAFFFLKLVFNLRKLDKIN